MRWKMAPKQAENCDIFCPSGRSPTLDRTGKLRRRRAFLRPPLMTRTLQSPEFAIVSPPFIIAKRAGSIGNRVIVDLAKRKGG